ncbi:MAG: carbonic anhydrase [Rikenellaceae bacterium]
MNRLFLVVSALVVAMSSCVGGGEPQCSACVVEVEESISKVETPAEAIEALKEGNARFVAQKVVNPHSNEARRIATVDSQNPFAAVVACSDSRVPVELLFDQGIGDLFVIRTAGNSVAGDLVMGSVDYAIDHLNVPLVVILGHQNCGGVTSSITVNENDHHHHEHNGKIGQLLEAIRADVREFVGKHDKLDDAILCNASAQVERLESVPYIAEKIESGKLQIVYAYYNFETGEVIFY